MVMHDHASAVTEDARGREMLPNLRIKENTLIQKMCIVPTCAALLTIIQWFLEYEAQYTNYEQKLLLSFKNNVTFTN